MHPVKPQVVIRWQTEHFKTQNHFLKMSTRIRLQRHGKKGKPFFHIVVADSRNRRDGRFIERLGYYNPTTVPATIDLDFERALHWVQVGAEPTNTANAILSYKGVLYMKHLMRGVEKGAFSLETAQQMYKDWFENKHAKIMDKKQKAHDEKTAKLRASVEAGKEKADAKLNPKEEEAPEVVAEESAEVIETPAVEETTQVVEETKVEEAPASEVIEPASEEEKGE